MNSALPDSRTHDLGQDTCPLPLPPQSRCYKAREQKLWSLEDLVNTDCWAPPPEFLIQQFAFQISPQARLVLPAQGSHLRTPAIEHGVSSPVPGFKSWLCNLAVSLNLFLGKSELQQYLSLRVC